MAASARPVMHLKAARRVSASKADALNAARATTKMIKSALSVGIL